MELSLLLLLAQREMNERPRALLMLALEQLELVRTALGLHRESAGAFGLAAVMGPGIVSVTGMSDPSSLAIPQTPDEMIAFARSWAAPGRKATIAARSFVHELVVLRRAVGAAARFAPDPAAAERRAAQFDTAYPMLVQLRDTLAHLDERFVAESYGKSIPIQPATVDGQTLDPGVSVRPGRISGHVKSGAFVDLPVDEEVLQAARSLILGVIARFPEKAAGPPG